MDFALIYGPAITCMWISVRHKQIVNLESHACATERDFCNALGISYTDSVVADCDFIYHSIMKCGSYSLV